MSTASSPSPPSAPRWWLMLLAAGFPSFVAIHTGLNLYLGNTHSLTSGSEGLVGLVGLALALWGVLFAALRWGRVVGKVLWALPSAYAVFFLVRELAFPLPLVPLAEGMSFVPQVSGAYRAAEVITLVVSLGLLLAIRLRWTAPLAAIFAVVFAFSALTATATNAGTLTGTDAPPPTASTPTAQVSAADKPDVYQILFDTYQTVEHQYARKLKGVAPYDDFIHYNNNISHYNWTTFSMPTIWGSTLYDPAQEVKEWQVAVRQKRGILKTLKDNGYHVKIYGTFPFWTDIACADVLRLDREVFQEWQERAGEDGFRVRSEEFLQLVKLRGLPTFLGKKAYAPSEKDKGIPPADIYSFYSMVKFREMVASIKERPTGGTYTFIHMILPHPPFAMNAEGEYVGRGRGTRFGQVLLVDKLVSEFIAELKRLGRYDRSMIVIHADTGFRIHPDLETQDLVNGKDLKLVAEWDPALKSLPGPEWPVSLVRAWSQAALLIKPPGHHGHEEVEAPTQLMDISPTILEAVGITDPNDSYSGGVNLLAALPSQDRVRKTYVFSAPRAGIPSVMQEYIVRGRNYEKGGIVITRGKTDND